MRVKLSNDSRWVRLKQIDWNEFISSKDNEFVILESGQFFIARRSKDGRYLEIKYKKDFIASPKTTTTFKIVGL